MKKSSFPKVIVIVVSLLLAVVMTFVAYMTGHDGLKGLTFEYYVQQLLINFAFAYTIGVLVPVDILGTKLAFKLGVKNETDIKCHFIRSFVMALVPVCILSFIFMFLDFGFDPMLFGAWIKAFPLLTLIVYVILLIFFPVCVKVTELICSKEG